MISDKHRIGESLKFLRIHSKSALSIYGNRMPEKQRHNQSFQSFFRALSYSESEIGNGC